MQKLFCLLIIFNLSIFFLPSYADCGDDSPDDMDKECKSTCSGTEEDLKGCYHLPDSGTTTDDICKEVSGGKYPKARADVCCCAD